MEEKITKLRPALYAMAIGETMTFPITRLKSVRTCASELGMMYERQYTTKTDRVSKTIEVTRKA